MSILYIYHWTFRLTAKIWFVDHFFIVFIYLIYFWKNKHETIYTSFQTIQNIMKNINPSIYEKNIMSYTPKINI